MKLWFHKEDSSGRSPFSMIRSLSSFHSSTSRCFVLLRCWEDFLETRNKNMKSKNRIAFSLFLFYFFLLMFSFILKIEAFIYHLYVDFLTQRGLGSTGIHEFQFGVVYKTNDKSPLPIWWPERERERRFRGRPVNESLLLLLLCSL